MSEPVQKGTPLSDPAAYVEGLAKAARCPRHLPHMRACAYRDGEPCRCREMMELIYGKQ